MEHSDESFLCGLKIRSPYLAIEVLGGAEFRFIGMFSTNVSASATEFGSRIREIVTEIQGTVRRLTRSAIRKIFHGQVSPRFRRFACHFRRRFSDTQTFGHQCNVFEPGLTRFARFGAVRRVNLGPFSKNRVHGMLHLNFEPGQAKKEKVLKNMRRFVIEIIGPFRCPNV